MNLMKILGDFWNEQFWAVLSTVSHLQFRSGCRIAKVNHTLKVQNYPAQWCNNTSLLAGANCPHWMLSPETHSTSQQQFSLGVYTYYGFGTLSVRFFFQGNSHDSMSSDEIPIGKLAFFKPRHVRYRISILVMYDLPRAGSPTMHSRTRLDWLYLRLGSLFWCCKCPGSKWLDRNTVGYHGIQAFRPLQISFSNLGLPPPENLLITHLPPPLKPFQQKHHDCEITFLRNELGVICVQFKV